MSWIPTSHIQVQKEKEKCFDVACFSVLPKTSKFLVLLFCQFWHQLTFWRSRSRRRHQILRSLLKSFKLWCDGLRRTMIDKWRTHFDSAKFEQMDKQQILFVHCIIFSNHTNLVYLLVFNFPLTKEAWEQLFDFIKVFLLHLPPLL